MTQTTTTRSLYRTLPGAIVTSSGAGTEPESIAAPFNVQQFTFTFGGTDPLVAGDYIVVVSGSYEGDKGSTVRVIGDKENRWPQARRIWNQHTYHVTNVNEGGTIPQFEQPSWKTHNTFRINSTLDAGGQQCEPPTPG